MANKKIDLLHLYFTQRKTILFMILRKKRKKNGLYFMNRIQCMKTLTNEVWEKKKKIELNYR